LIEFRTGGRTIGFGSLKLQYDEVSSTVIVNGKEVDGAAFVEDMRHVLQGIEKSRIRNRHDSEQRADRSWVASKIDADGVLKLQRDLAWDNLPLYYPEAKRGKVQERTPMARGIIEDE
jgi:hypothetical protein